MRKLIENLLSIVSKLIEDFGDKKGNLLRYKIGEAFSNFYTTNKDEISQTENQLDVMMLSFYSEKGINADNLNELKSKNLSNWDKVKLVVSDWLNHKYSSDGYGITNLGYMQQFYRKYRNSPDSLELANQLEWSHNIELLKDKLIEDERKYYLKRAIKEKWTVKELQKQIKDEAYDDFMVAIENSNFKYRIEKVFIKNYKSIVQLTIEQPSQFLVFAGANATGKSNIFEAIEFLMHSAMTQGTIVFDIFGGDKKVMNYAAQKDRLTNNWPMEIMLELSFGNEGKKHSIEFGIRYDFERRVLQKNFTGIPELDKRIINSFSRIFIENKKRAENKLKVYNKLWLDASNLSTILKDILKEKRKRNEMNEWIQILIPEIDKITIAQDLTGKEELQVTEKTYPDRPFTGNLISEGTINIIALLTLFYQTDDPQFICIEEPETGLNPAILHELVPFFREMKAKYNHHIWITTHSTSIVAELTEEELIIVSKKNGQTEIYPCKKGDFEEMKPDEAWMSNMLKGGGLPW